MTNDDAEGTKNAPELRLTRRRLLLGGTAAVAVSAGGFVWFSDPRTLIIDIVEHALPGVRFETASLNQFADDFLDDWKGPDPGPATTSRVKFAAAASRLVGMGTLNAFGQFETSEGFGRDVVTSFLLSSNFFDVDDPRSSSVVYTRRAPGTPCRSTPWGDVSPPTPR